MLFNSIEYIFLFIPVVFTVYFLLCHFKLYTTSKFFLLIASLYFYGTYKWSYIPIIICSILFNYFISFIFKLKIKEYSKKFFLIFCITGNILMLVFFKYFNFLVDAFSRIHFSPFNTMEIILPLGISFFTLQQISYIIDCYKERVKEYNLLDYSLFVCFFPQLVAGPIVRHQEMIPQFRDLSRKVINQDNIFIGIFLITIGLLKKTVFADNFTDFITYIQDYEIYNDFYISWFLGLSKVLQGYFDFSGYCDMALGSAFLFNISLPWNFNSPYKATSILDYWKRWNMTLVRFLKDYIYKPLGSDKKGLLNTCLNIMIVFFIYGCWKGSNPVNVIYGILNGILVCINKIWSKFKITIPNIISVVMTFITLIFLTTFIQISSLKNVIQILKSMIGYHANFCNMIIRDWNLIFTLNEPHNAKFNFIILILSMFIVFFCKNSTQLARIYIKSTNSLYTILLVILFVYATLSITKSSEFIYFIF